MKSPQNPNRHSQKVAEEVVKGKSRKVNRRLKKKTKEKKTPISEKEMRERESKQNRWH